MPDDPASVRAEIRAGRYTGPTAGLAAGLGAGQRRFVAGRRRRRFRPILPPQRPGLSRCSTKPRQAIPGRAPVPRRPTCGPTCRAIASFAAAWPMPSSRPTSAICGATTLVGFLIGCSFTFERALVAAGLPVRHLEMGTNVPMYRTNRPCQTAGRFAGPLVVSMRPYRPEVVDRVRAITSRFPRMHGAADPRRRTGAVGHCRPGPARFRRSGRNPAGRGAGVLGLRRDVATGGRRGADASWRSPTAPAAC